MFTILMTVIFLYYYFQLTYAKHDKEKIHGTNRCI